MFTPLLFETKEYKWGFIEQSLFGRNLVGAPQHDKFEWIFVEDLKTSVGFEVGRITYVLEWNRYTGVYLKLIAYGRILVGVSWTVLGAVIEDQCFRAPYLRKPSYRSYGT